MTFYFALLLATVVPAYFFLKSINGESTKHKRLGLWLHVSSMPLMMGFLVGIMFSRSWKDGDINYAPLLIGIGAILSVVNGAVMAFAAARQSSETPQANHNRALTSWVLVALAGAYLAWTVVDHYSFYANPKKNGMVNHEVFIEAKIPCDADFILIKEVDKSFDYRCPHNLALGHWFGQPFVPWPSYSKGNSSELYKVYQDLMKEAEQFTAEARNTKK